MVTKVESLEPVEPWVKKTVDDMLSTPYKGRKRMLQLRLWTLLRLERIKAK